MRKRILSLLLCAAMVCATGCGGKSESNVSEEASMTIAYQYGLAYAPVLIAQQQELIEERYKEATGNAVNITWTQMSSGADINTGIASNEIQIGFMGVAPAVTGVMQGLNYKIFSNVSGQEEALFTSDPSVTSLADFIGTDKQIALVNIGSIQHIVLAKALSESGYDPHALDSNIVAMAHPDGMTALLNNTVDGHLTTSPYIYEERKEGYTELAEVTDAWSVDYSHIVGVASNELKNNNEELYKAVCEALEQAVEYVNAEPEESAKVLIEFDENNLEDEIEWLKAGTYSTETSNVYETARFMADAGFIETAPDNYEALVFDNVSGN